VGETVRQVTTPAGDPAWQVSGYALVRQLLVDPRLGRGHPDPANAPRYSRSVLFGRAAKAGQDTLGPLRKVLNQWLSASRLTEMRPQVDRLTDGVLADLAAHSPPVDFHEVVSFPLPALVICELLGVPAGDRATFRGWCDEAANTADEQRSIAGLTALWQYMGSLVDGKLADPGRDVLTDLVALHVADPDGCSRQQVTQLAVGLLFAGHETTVAAIDRGTVLLLTNPDEMRRLRDEPARLRGFVEEVLRLPLPPPVRPDGDAVGGVPRFAAEDIELDGALIRAGELVLLDLTTSNVDADAFTAPQRLDPTRSEGSHLTFGHGPHFCSGAALARIELESVFSRLVRGYPTLRLAVPLAQLQLRRERLAGGLVELPVRW
jgi:pentalenolactone synthase